MTGDVLSFGNMDDGSVGMTGTQMWLGWVAL